MMIYMLKHHISTWKLHTLKINKFYVNMQVFYTVRNDVLCNNIKTYSVLIAFFAADPFKHSMSWHSYTRGRSLFVSLFNGKKNQHDSRVYQWEGYRKNSNIKFVYSRGYGRYVYEMLFNWMKRKEALIALTCVGMCCYLKFKNMIFSLP